MKSIPFILIQMFVFLVMACSANKEEAVATNQELFLATTDSTIVDSALSFNKLVTDDSVRVNFSIADQQYDAFDLLIELTLFGESYIVSPLEKHYPYGAMTLTFEENPYFEIMQDLIESPVSKLYNEAGWDEPYKVIRNKVKLNQEIKLLTSIDFEVSGKLFFVLEPTCIPYELKFVIIQKEGVISVIED